MCMTRLHPKYLIFPSMILSAVVLLLISNSVAINHLTQIGASINSSPDLSNSNQRINHLSKEYPESIQKWREEIERSAEQYNLDPNLIAAVMLQESGGQPSVISSSGAVGLMQIMPKDGIASGFICGIEPCFMNRPAIQELLDSNFNIIYGARMLSGLQRTSGSLRAALKAYGPMDVGFSYADLVLSIYSKNN